MKKFILAAVCVAVAAVSQAVQLSWKAPTGQSWTSSVTQGALIYSENGSATLDQIAEFAKTGGTLEGFQNVTSTEEGLSKWTIHDGVENVVASSQNAPASTGNYYLVLFNENKSAYAIATIAANADATQKAWSVVRPEDNPVAIEPSFSGTIVPEPTVLALLALGVAGVALKRRA